MLRRSQGSATATKTRYPQRVGHRPAQGPEPRHEDGGPGGPGGSSLRGRVGRSRIADQVEPADKRDFARGVGLPPRHGHAGEQAARDGVRLHRVRAVHARGVTRPARTRGPVVVGGLRHERVRPPLGKPHRRTTRDAGRAGSDRGRHLRSGARRGPRRDRRPANGRGSLQDDPRGALRAVVPVLPSHGGRVRGSRGWVQVQGRGRRQVPRGQRREGVEQGELGAHVVPDRAAVPERKGRVRETRIGAKGPGVAEHLRRIHRRQALMWETRTRV
mmetsp:Transcript_5500/g.24715  ORF Transcript_5500/g.24715 Transcript_5500/m.24715 type:complete len:273 (-) Transcript_5500:70-888(-)